MRKQLIIGLLISAVFVFSAISIAYWTKSIQTEPEEKPVQIIVDDFQPKDYVPVTKNTNLVQLIRDSTSETKIFLLEDVEINSTNTLSSFNGILDGNGYTIRNTDVISGNITGSRCVLTGFIGEITSGSVVRNVVLENFSVNATVTNSTNSYGAIITAYNHGLVENVAI